jgi:predicted MFS family arabinose efflux permease
MPLRLSMPTPLARRPHLTPDAGELPTAEEARNGRLLVWEAPFTSLVLLAAPSFYALFAIEMGGSNAAVGWLSSGPALLSLLWLIPCSQLIQRASGYKLQLLIGIGLHRLLILLMAATPLLPPAWRPWGLVALVTLTALPLQYWGLTFDTFMGDSFAPRHLARFIGRRWAALDITNTVAVILLGKMIDAAPFPYNWMALFGGLSLLGVISLFFIARLDYPSRHAPADDAPARGENLLDLLRRHRAFILLETGICVIYAGFFAAAPVLRIYWVRDLGATGAWVGILTAAFSAGAVLGGLLWGRWSKPTRDRTYALVGGLGAMAAYPCLTAAFTALPPLVAVIAAGGFLVVGNDLLLFKRVVATSPRWQRATFIAINNLVINLVAFLAPLASTALVDRLGARPVLWLAAGVGLVGAVLTYAIGWHPIPQETTEPCV